MIVDYVSRVAGGEDACQVIQEATSASGLYHFGELLDQPQIAQVRCPGSPQNYLHTPHVRREANLSAVAAYRE